MSKFKLGVVVCTKGIVESMKSSPDFEAFVNKSFSRYVEGDWGDTCEEDAAMNDEALKTGEDRILAVYIFKKAQENPEKIWIITEWDRSATTILFPSEY